ncbi:single-stranded DNA-binding protein [Sphingobacterium hungaricum]|uniref:Single-stranded DNA-binding protein n=1 Tax=Sphingobacterium hungaricum TaxID=2082723 RepID=A0A928YTW8_9SPHI|nr:single-stranded DNA-binding protein [Sphingobacterium hungaricum]MBE8715543.1 single-stranded DNA-binding protein [Sphingobacterium hungaricum]
MENSMNKVMLSGFAGADTELKTVAGNKKLAKVNFAVNESFRNGGGQEVKKTSWFTLTFWNEMAELASEKIKKGTNFSIEGRLNNGTYEAKDGTKRYVTNIIVNEIEFIN